MKIGLHLILYVFMIVSAYPQDKMLIGQLSDRLVVRENFDENGKFLNKQALKRES